MIAMEMARGKAVHPATHMWGNKSIEKLEEEAAKAAYIEEAVNAVERKYKATGWKKFPYKEVRATSMHLP